jgi:hypothetical protein
MDEKVMTLFPRCTVFDAPLFRSAASRQQRCNPRAKICGGSDWKKGVYNHRIGGDARPAQTDHGTESAQNIIDAPNYAQKFITIYVIAYNK